jgi:hypothetical protein
VTKPSSVKAKSPTAVMGLGAGLGSVNTGELPPPEPPPQEKTPKDKAIKTKTCNDFVMLFIM